MKEYKLYKLFVNNGDWNGHHSLYEIASSEEEAIAQNEVYRDYVEMGYDHCIKEMTPEDIIHHFLSYKDDGTFNIEFRITKRGEE